MNTKPHVFVSSTCYDLSQIRKDLSEFIESVGFHPMMSEFASFPVDPDATTIENCIANVRRHADLFVLIVGKRYGSTDPSGKSITNLEYLAAREEGVPVYAFVSKEVLSLLPVWNENRDKAITFPGIDSGQLLEFVDELREHSGTWVFPFESAQHIEQALRQQWAVLVASMLDNRRRTSGRRLSRHFAHLSPEAQRLILEQPDLWEYRLFAQILRDGISSLRFRRRDFDLGLSFLQGRYVPNSEIFAWLQGQMSMAQQVPARINRLFNGPVMESFGPAGVAGDPEAIVHVAERTVATYEKALDWAEELRAASVHERVARLTDIGARLVSRMLDEFESFARKCYETIESEVKSPSIGTEPRKIELVLQLSIDDAVLEEWRHELEDLLHSVERGEFSLDDDQ